MLAEGRSLARTLPEPSAVRVYFLPCKREEAPGQGLIIPTRIQAPENSASPPPGKGTVGRPVFFHPFIAVRPSASHPFLEKFFQKSNYSHNCCFCFIFSRGSARLFPKSLLWVLRVWKLGEGFLGTTSHQGLLGNKSLPQARPRRKEVWDCHLHAVSPFTCQLFPQQPQGVFLALGMGNPAPGSSAGRPGRLAPCPLCGPGASGPAGVRPPPPHPVASPRLGRPSVL